MDNGHTSFTPHESTQHASTAPTNNEAEDIFSPDIDLNEKNFGDAATIAEGFQTTPKSVNTNSSPLDQATPVNISETAVESPLPFPTELSSTDPSPAESSLAESSSAESPFPSTSPESLSRLESTPILGKNHNNTSPPNPTSPVTTSRNLSQDDNLKITKRGLGKPGLEVVKSINDALEHHQDPAKFYNDIELIKRTTLRNSYANRRDYLKGDDFDKSLQEAA